MSFCWVTVSVQDMDESIRFYQDIVGLKLNSRFKAGHDVEIAFLGDGETKVELKFDKNDQITSSLLNVALGFEVGSLEEKMNFVKDKGIAIHSGPFAPNPNIRFFYILDPNGLKVQFVEQVKEIE